MIQESSEQDEIEVAVQQAMGNLQLANIAQSVRIQRQTREISALRERIASLEDQLGATTPQYPPDLDGAHAGVGTEDSRNA